MRQFIWSVDRDDRLPRRRLHSCAVAIVVRHRPSRMHNGRDYLAGLVRYDRDLHQALLSSPAARVKRRRRTGRPLIVPVGFRRAIERRDHGLLRTLLVRCPTCRSIAGMPLPVTGIAFACVRADRCSMLWPVAALAVLVVGFVLVYGSVIQSRLEAGFAGRAPDLSTDEDPTTRR